MLRVPKPQILQGFRARGTRWCRVQGFKGSRGQGFRGLRLKGLGLGLRTSLPRTMDILAPLINNKRKRLIRVTTYLYSMPKRELTSGPWRPQSLESERRPDHEHLNTTLRPQGCRAARVFFFVVAPFCSCPASLVSRKFFCCRPRVCKVFFFLLRSVGRRDLSAGPEQKKKTPPGCFFLLRPRGKAGEGEAPCRHGARAKKNTTQGVFFAAAPAKGKGRRSPVGRRHGARAKKKNTTQGVFFDPAPGKGRGRAAAKKKKHPGWCFFFCSGPVPARGFSFPCLSPGPEQKKNTLGGVFFFCCGPARTLTHSLRAWVAMPPPRRGGVFFFAAAPPAPGWCFFFCCGPARTLTHSLWAGAISARPGWCFFFCCGPAGSF